MGTMQIAVPSRGAGDEERLQVNWRFEAGSRPVHIARTMRKWYEALEKKEKRKRYAAVVELLTWPHKTPARVRDNCYPPKVVERSGDFFESALKFSQDYAVFKGSQLQFQQLLLEAAMQSGEGDVIDVAKEQGSVKRKKK